MKPRNHPHDSNELGIVWYLIPGIWLVVAIAGFAVVAYWPTLLAGPMPQETSTAGAFSVAPFASSEEAVPAASSVFTDRNWEVSEHVDQF